MNPWIATNKTGQWVVVWYSNDTLGGTVGSDNDVFVSRSSNGGVTWTAVQALNANAKTDVGSDTYPCVTTDGSGQWVTVWQSTGTLGGTIGTDNDILVACSSDNGATWTMPVALNTNAGVDLAADDDTPAVLADGSGNWVTVWNPTDPVGGTCGTDADILASRSTNNGLTWSVPQALTTTAMSDRGTDGSALLATDGNGIWVVVWNSDDDLQYTTGTDYEIVVARFAEPDCNANGVSDLSETDTDGDGRPDCLDGCPRNPSKVEAGACGCGAADSDADGDGLVDCCNGQSTEPAAGDEGSENLAAPVGAFWGIGAACGAGAARVMPFTLAGLGLLRGCRVGSGHGRRSRGRRRT